MAVSIMRSFLGAVFMVLMLPALLNNGNGHAQLFQPQVIENYIETNGHGQDQDGGEGDEGDEGDQNIQIAAAVNDDRDWFEEEIDSDVKWCLALNRVEFQGSSGIQNLKVLATRRFGKALVIDGHLQCTEFDDYIYHESLVHPALLVHNEPKSVFIMGGGGGSAAREVLKHRNIEKVIICDIDREIVNVYRQHITANHEAFNDERLQIVYNEAMAELENSEEKFDIILGDLSDPKESGPSNNLYTRSFYEDVAKPKLKENGLFVTQAGPAGILTHKAVFSPIYNTLKQVFTHLVAYTTQVPSYGDSCGWILASNEPIILDSEQLDIRIGERINGELRYLDGLVIAASTVLNKTMKNSLMEETCILTEENVGFVRGRGVRNDT
ncbi:thermospermine synthase ACAULIS5-like [Gastrolobium bilobum]|uniref:thermospermine synthase ACAULIS5-like n=1 Tax=Gastrolobium bilobum TaxID=150636 RepID=UPI002AAF8E81|nr:thermospermine synthase ACAULIS5-like [Gastrolobium bilobum]